MGKRAERYNLGLLSDDYALSDSHIFISSVDIAKMTKLDQGKEFSWRRQNGITTESILLTSLHFRHKRGIGTKNATDKLLQDMYAMQTSRTVGIRNKNALSKGETLRASFGQ